MSLDPAPHYPAPAPTPLPADDTRLEFVTIAWLVRALDGASIYDLHVYGGKGWVTVEAKIGDRDGPPVAQRNLMCTGPTLAQAFDLFLKCVSTLDEKNASAPSSNLDKKDR